LWPRQRLRLCGQERLRRGLERLLRSVQQRLLQEALPSVPLGRDLQQQVLRTPQPLLQ
jgi:hypothetical protein